MRIIYLTSRGVQDYYILKYSYTAFGCDNAHFVYDRVALFVYFVYYLFMFMSIFTLIWYKDVFKFRYKEISKIGEEKLKDEENIQEKSVVKDFGSCMIISVAWVKIEEISSKRWRYDLMIKR